MRKVFSLALVFLLLLGTITTASAKGKSVTVYVVKSTYEYSTNKVAQKRHEIGDKVTITGKKGDWFKLKNGNYIHSSSVASNPLKYFCKKYNDIVLVSISKQYVIYYKKGKIVAQGDCVTGHSSRSPTPKGLYVADRSKTDTNLNGNPEHHVDYFIGFNGSIGLHDAFWRNGEFGGSIYKHDGSHGCVNLPLEVIKQIYKNCNIGKTRVLVF